MVDCMMEDRPIDATSSILLTIPLEILTIILRYVALDKSDLASLALVNSDCRQLARSCQFSELVLDFGPRSVEVLAELQKEAVQRMRFPNATLSPSLGTCVRKLRSSLDEYWPQVASLKLDEERDEMRLDQWRAAARLIATYMNKLYMPTVLLVIPALPYLDSLDLSSCDLDDELLDCITMSAVKNLRLDGSFKRTPNMRVGRHPWPLETLSIRANWDVEFAYRPLAKLDSSSFWQSFLGICCSTLRYLKLDQRNMNFPGCENIHIPIFFNLDFPSLNTLLIGLDTSIDAITLSSLLRANLSILKVDYSEAITRQVLFEVDQIPTLKTLILGGYEIPDSGPVRIIEINKQITSFAVEWNQSDIFLRRMIHSLIDHDNLRILSLKWKENEIPEESLHGIARLSQVEVLHLSAGESAGFPHDWFVDHNQLKMYLVRLANLRRLVITRDTYQLPLDESVFVEPERYYVSRGPKNGTRWTKHVNQMLEHASAYVQTFPKLEFVHVGQVLFTVHTYAGSRKPVATGAAWVGDEEYDVMSREFGIDV